MSEARFSVSSTDGWTLVCVVVGCLPKNLVGFSCMDSLVLLCRIMKYIVPDGYKSWYLCFHPAGFL
jgi:hypothetical protein